MVFVQCSKTLKTRKTPVLEGFLCIFWLRRWDLNHMTSGLWARRATGLLYSAILFLVPWCRWPGSNRYDALASRDFKSRASACSATPAGNTKRLASFRFALLIIAHTLPFVKPFLKNLFFFFALFTRLFSLSRVSFSLQTSAFVL